MPSSLSVLHVLRAPVGGLFRHVLDLAESQADLGHRVGLIADASTGGAWAEERLAALAPKLALGVSRVPMSRHIGLSDLEAIRHVGRRAAEAEADILHGHGAKGGAFARLASSGAVRVYTPHGGSLHYRRSSPVGLVYLTLEQVLRMRTDVFLFESAYGRDAFEAKIGPPGGIVHVVHNGLRPAEFDPIAPSRDASDFVYVGELRTLKGVDVLIDALLALHRGGRRVTATIVGDGPDAGAFRTRARPLGSSVTFTGAMPARRAFALGRCLVVPSRAESLPYVVLEAAAAGIAVIACDVGGIPEIFGPFRTGLVPPGSAAALTASLLRALDQPQAMQARTVELRARLQDRFSLAGMCDAVLGSYREAQAARVIPARPALIVS